MNVWLFLFIDRCVSFFERIGRCIAVTDARNQTIHTTYDAEDRVTATTVPPIPSPMTTMISVVSLPSTRGAIPPTKIMEILIMKVKKKVQD